MVRTPYLRALARFARQGKKTLARSVHRRIAQVLIAALLFQIAAAALPPGATPLAPALAAAAGEVLASPRYVAATVMPNGHVGLVFQHVASGVPEIRFKRYTSERSTDASIQLSTTAALYPRLTTFKGTLVASYVDTRSPNAGKLAFRVSTDNGATWSAESYPLGTATFDANAFAPQVVGSRDGNSLYVFSATSGVAPQYRVSTDATLATWSTAAAAGDSTITVPSGNSCGSAGAECGRAHAFSFTETAIAGRWLYIAKSPSGFGQSGRGTQYGTLGGSWSAQIDHGGSGGLSGGGQSTATAFVDRAGDLVYVRATEWGDNLYWKRSTDDGAGWTPEVTAYSSGTGNYWTAAPVGLYVPGYSQGEYVFWAGFGGTEDTVRVNGLWRAPSAYSDSGTARLFGSAGGDWDAGWEFPETFGDGERALGPGNLTTSATDLVLPGRRLPFAFTRTYNSADPTSGAFGPGWTHSYDWRVSENAGIAEVRRGDGRIDRYTRNPDGSYAAPSGVFDVLVRNADASFTLTLRDQTKLEFSAVAPVYAASIDADAPAGFWRFEENSGTLVADAEGVQNGTASSGVTRGVPGVAGSLAGAFASASVSIPSNAAFNFGTGDYTIELWAYRTGAGGNTYPTLISKRAWVSGTEPGWGIYAPTADPTKLALHVNNRDVADTGMQTGTGVFTPNLWHHVALVFSSSDRKGRLYVDGALVLTTPATDATTGASNSAAIAIGNDNGNYGNTFAGHVDEVAIYPSALAATRIAAHAALNPATRGQLMRIHEPAGNQITLGYAGTRLATITDTAGRVVSLTSSSDPGPARAKFYRTSVAASGSYPDSGADRELTDGVIGSATSFGDLAWQGHTLGGGTLDITLDLGAARSLATIRSFHYHDAGNGIYKPASVEVLTSTDGVTYTSHGSTASTAAVNEASNRWRYDRAVNTSARWLRLRVSSGGTWLFSSEIEDSAGALLGRAYTKSVATHGNYADTGVSELTDGVLGSATAPNDAGWQAHANLGAPLEATIDLGDEMPLGLVRSFHFHFTNDGIYKPASIELLTSTDNVTYTSRGTTTSAAATLDAGYRWRYDMNAGGASARWVRLRITAGGTWLFSSEIEAWGVGVVPPVAGIGERVLALRDPIGRTTSYGYDSAGRLSTVTDRIGNSPGQSASAHRWTYTYDGATRHLATVTDPDGRTVVTNTWDTSGRLATQKDGRNNQSSFSYSSGQTVITTPRSHQITQTFDPRQRLLSEAVSLGGVTKTQTYEYDDAGNRDAVIDREGHRTDLTYDSRGNVLTVVAPQLHPSIPRATTTNVYDTRNNLTSTTDPRGFETTFSYDTTTNVLLAKVQEVTQSSTVTTKYEYDDTANPGLVTRVIAPRGNTTGTPDNTYSTTFDYDVEGNLVEINDADGARTTHAYDDLGRRTATVDPDGYATGATAADHTWTTAYDALDRVTSETNPLGKATTYAYDGAGHRTSLTDRNGHATTYLYDAAGRLEKVRQKPDPTGQPTLVYETALTRDANGNTTKVTRANGVVSDYAYDALDRLTGVTSHPTSTTTLTTTYTLDGRGLATSRTAGNGQVTSSQYDAMGRLVQVSATGLSTISYAYDAGSLRTGMTDGTGSSTYAYDGLGRLTEAVQPNGTTTYAYDLDSNLTTLGYPTVGNVAYSYSAGGRLASLTDWASRTTSYTYTAQGLAKTVSVPGGMTTTYAYDRADRLTSLTNTVGTTTLTSHTYSLDDEGNRTGLDEFVEGITAPSSTDSFGMSYDGLERLKAVTGAVAEGFTLDAGSNLASRTGPSKTFSYDTSDRLTSDGTSTHSWDDADRLVAAGSETYAYDPLSRLTFSEALVTTSTGSVMADLSYTYNGDGLLASRTQDGGAATGYLWDPLTPLARLLQIGSDRIVYGLGPLYGVKADGSTVAFARDGMKSVRAEVNGSGAVTKSFRYTAYGDLQAANATGATPSFLAYNSQLRDGSGLTYLRARWYEPATGRFITRDPLLGSADSPATLNAFGYGGGNPLTMSDPSGLMVESDEDGPQREGPFDSGADCAKCGGLPPGPGGGTGSGWSSGQASASAPGPYMRPSHATTKSQRDSVQGRPCVDCGDVTGKQVADHKVPLVREWYESGKIDQTRMRALDAVQPQCPGCSAASGGRLSWYSRHQRQHLEVLD